MKVYKLNQLRVGDVCATRIGKREFTIVKIVENVDGWSAMITEQTRLLKEHEFTISKGWEVVKRIPINVPKET